MDPRSGPNALRRKPDDLSKFVHGFLSSDVPQSYFMAGRDHLACCQQLAVNRKGFPGLQFPNGHANVVMLVQVYHATAHGVLVRSCWSDNNAGLKMPFTPATGSPGFPCAVIFL
jgi:hypothetical protein